MYSSMNKDEIIIKLTEENSLLKTELESAKNHLKRYTAPIRNKKYYEANRELIKNREYKVNISQEQRAEYNRRAYQKRKENKNKKEKNENI